MTIHKIQIKPGNPPATDPYYVKISRCNEDRVEWVSDSKDWVVVFKDLTPFERSYFTPSYPEAQSIKVDSGPTEYEYIVCVNGKRSASPMIKVDP